MYTVHLYDVSYRDGRLEILATDYPQYAHNDGAPHIQNIYHHNNTQNMVWGNDREMMTCDGGGGVYFGAATSKGAVVTLGGKASGAQPGGSVCVLRGTGTGECRRVVSTASAPPAPPAPPSPTSNLTAGAFAVLTPCAGGNTVRVTMPSSKNNQSLSSGKLDAVVLCDPPGHGSSSTQCGENVYFEPLEFALPDSWTQQYQTSAFVLVGQHIKLVKGGGKCVGADSTSAGSPIGMGPCAGSSSADWAYDAATQQLQLHSGDNNDMCFGHSSGSRPPPAPPTGAAKYWTVDSPYTVELDETSMVSITPYIGQIAFNGNFYSDGGEIQFYAQAYGIVAAENKFERTGGAYPWQPDTTTITGSIEVYTEGVYSLYIIYLT